MILVVENVHQVGVERMDALQGGIGFNATVALAMTKSGDLPPISETHLESIAADRENFAA